MGGWHRISSDDDFQIRQVLPVGAQFCFWARWPWVFAVKSIYYILIATLAFSNTEEPGRGGWSNDVVILSYCTSQVSHISQGIGFAHV